MQHDIFNSFPDPNEPVIIKNGLYRYFQNIILCIRYDYKRK